VRLTYIFLHKKTAQKRKHIKSVLLAILVLLVAVALTIAVAVIRDGNNGGWLLAIFAIVIFINGVRSR
jgi:hypothetical protein